MVFVFLAVHQSVSYFARILAGGGHLVTTIRHNYIQLGFALVVFAGGANIQAMGWGGCFCSCVSWSELLGDVSWLFSFRMVFKMKTKLLLGLAFVLSGGLLGFCDAIHEAAAQGDLAKVKELVKNNPNLVFSRNQDGETPLLWAVSSDRRDVVEFLLANKADVNDPAINSRMGTTGFTPLQEASSLGLKGMVELLLAHHADINARDYQEDTCLHLAATSIHPEVMATLLSHGININATNYIGMTALHYAAMDGKTTAAAFLVTNNANINCRNNAGMTPLIWAAYQGRKEVAEILLASKADVNVRDKAGNTALHYAAINGHREVVQLLLTNAADLNQDGALVDKALQSASKSALQSGQASSNPSTAKQGMDAKLLGYHKDLADKGDAYGELRMGLRYHDGDGVPQDLDKAREWLQKAADQGDSDAASALDKLPKPQNSGVSVSTNSVNVDADFVLVSAEFGTGKRVADVTARVGELLRSKPDGFATDVKTLGADPFPGKKKRLTIHYRYQGVEYTFINPVGKPVSQQTLVDNARKKP